MNAEFAIAEVVDSALKVNVVSCVSTMEMVESASTNPMVSPAAFDHNKEPVVG